MEEKSCCDCGFYKQNINRRKMAELNTNEVIWLNICENVNMELYVEDLKVANTCEHYDDDTWMK